MIDYKKLVDLIQEQLLKIMAEDADYYKDFNFILSNEQQFVKVKYRKPNTIYIVVKFFNATLNYGQSVLPFGINAIGEANKLEVCQRLLSAYAQTYNLTRNEDGTIRQTYTSPSVVASFNEVNDSYRDLFFVNGTFLISELNNSIESIVINEIKIDAITFQTSLDAQPDPQAYYGSKNIVQTINKTATYTLSFTSYFINNEFYNSILGIINKTISINKPYNFTVTFKNGTIITKEVRLLNASFQQNIGELPIIALVFIE